MSMFSQVFTLVGLALVLTMAFTGAYAKPTVDNNRLKRSTPTCTPKSEEVIKQEWIAYNSDLTNYSHSSFYMLPQVKESIKHHLNKSSYEHYIYLDSSNANCPDTSNGFNPESNELKDRSICPWLHVINYDSKRFPTDLVEAKCRNCENCIGLDDNSVYTCQPIYYNVKVLRKTNQPDASGFCTYEKSFQRLATSCNCAERPSA